MLFCFLYFCLLGMKLKKGKVFNVFLLFFFMIITISGSVGSGKTTIANLLSERLGDFEVIHLNEWAKEFKLNEVKDLQTFDFNIDGLIAKVNRFIADNSSKNLILEGHFAHFINPSLVNFLFVINRDLSELKKEYEKRGYNEQKVVDNLEVESFNLCFYEGIEEGYGEIKDFELSTKSKNNRDGSVFCIENKGSLENVVREILNIVKSI